VDVASGVGCDCHLLDAGIDVLRDSSSGDLKESESSKRKNVALIRRLLIKVGGTRRVLGYAEPVLVHRSEIELGDVITLRNRFLKPLGGFDEIRLDHGAFAKRAAEVPLALGISTERGFANPMKGRFRILADPKAIEVERAKLRLRGRVATLRRFL